MARKKKPHDPFRWFDSSPEVIRLVVLMYVRYPLSLRNVEDLLFERGIDICHETVRLWWNRFGPMFASEIRRKRVQNMRQFTHWNWHLDEVFVRINGKQKYLWRAVDHEGEGDCQEFRVWAGHDGKKEIHPWPDAKSLRYLTRS
jgi:putative transposase